MIDPHIIPAWAPDIPGCALPADCVELPELSVSAARKLGYFGEERFVIFGYCAAGAEVVWVDGRRSGFGTGGWKYFHSQVIPVALRHGVDLGGGDACGTSVLLVNRRRGCTHAAPRAAALKFLFDALHLQVPARKCLCEIASCASCPMRPGDVSHRSSPPEGHRGRI